MRLPEHPDRLVHPSARPMIAAARLTEPGGRRNPSWLGTFGIRQRLWCPIAADAISPHDRL
jgi:hypothetical protein